MKIILFFIAYIAVLCLIVLTVKAIGRRNAIKARQQLEYMLMVANIKDIIKARVLSEKSYHEITGHFCSLVGLKYTDRETTEVLYTQFLRDYKPIIDEINSRDEHSPEQVFMQNDLMI